MQALDIPVVCAKAFKLAMTPANIQSGFEVTGIYPFNRSRISDEEFLPSFVTDRPEPVPADGETSTLAASAEKAVHDSEDKQEAGRPFLKCVIFKIMLCYSFNGSKHFNFHCIYMCFKLYIQLSGSPARSV